MFFNEESEYSFYITGFLLAFCSIMTLLFLPFNVSNRRRYKFVKIIRNTTFYVLIPLFLLLLLLQVYGFIAGDFITIDYSLWRLTYLIGAGMGFYVSRQKILLASVDGIKYFRRGSFNSGKFQKTFNNCRRHYLILIFLCLAILAGQYLFMR